MNEKSLILASFPIKVLFLYKNLCLPRKPYKFPNPFFFMFNFLKEKLGEWTKNITKKTAEAPKELEKKSKKPGKKEQKNKDKVKIETDLKRLKEVSEKIS
jgi:hypothetical protein